MIKLDNQTIQLALFALIALAMLVQAFVLFAAFIALRKAARSADEKIEEIRSSVMPIIETTRDVVAKLAPKIESTGDDIAALTRSLRAQTSDIQSVATEIVGRVRTQTGRIDTLLSNTLDAVDRATGFMTDTMARPIRQISALLASIKAAVESLRNFEPAPHVRREQESGDSDMFV